ncbi:F-box domain-containing protein [Pseudomonas xantholysinigenes]|uniref:F-box domain-containing protein n=1 Tax=Pseudomonas xantholysinigenes TaxID=2745490 RepID=A0A9E6TYD8_9PSED|nr:F-box domain-containing protein [Pseudomonas xantholysinigenes]QXI38905.1 F-box domain-containing protein [Pseudomonas xantholysinigenes]
MLNAVLAGKKKGTGLHNQALDIERSEGAEDVLTATLFERLAYLPDEPFCKVFEALLGEPFGPLQSITFWPSWYLPEGNTRVEPDVLLSDGNRTLLIEAKRRDHYDQQDPAQLARELRAGWHAGVLETGSLLLTLGGLKDTSQSGQGRLLDQVHRELQGHTGKPFTLICRSWQELFQALEDGLEGTFSGAQRLLEDLARCYAWHHLKTHPVQWLNALPSLHIETPPGAFAAWSLK